MFAYLTGEDAKLAYVTAFLCMLLAYGVLSLPTGIMDFDFEAVRGCARPAACAWVLPSSVLTNTRTCVALLRTGPGGNGREHVRPAQGAKDHRACARVVRSSTHLAR